MCVNTTLHFDITSGIAGDMSLAVLYGLGLNLSEIETLVDKIAGVQITIIPERVSVNGIDATRLNIKLPHEHAHRKLSDIRDMIEKADLPDKVKNDAIGIFQIIAEAEGAVHGKTADDVHFHEIGALDSILDIVGFVYGVHRLGIDKITASKPVLGSGFVKCAHGKVPVPAPATLKILEGVAVKRTDEPNELTTPTGAAILKYYVSDFSTEYEGEIAGSAYSTGTITLKTMPNILRGTLIKNQSAKEQITVIETNIDDCSGEVIGALFDKLKNVSLDVFCTPLTGKKNRPAVQITVLCTDKNIDDAAEILFRHSSTAGLRYHKTDRIIMDRKIVQTDVRGEKVDVKVLSYKNIRKYSPEWSACEKVSVKLGLSAFEVYDLAKASMLD
ncbi:nickel pincer cofactor biosynthesis protein LarC [Deferribacteres bacterium DY0037]